jgi:hypothetical protein
MLRILVSLQIYSGRFDAKWLVLYTHPGKKLTFFLTGFNSRWIIQGGQFKIARKFLQNQKIKNLTPSVDEEYPLESLCEVSRRSLAN